MVGIEPTILFYSNAISSAIMIVNLTENISTPISECFSADISGISSSTTTYTIAPYTAPCAIMASATFKKPAIFAPAT